MKNKEMQLKSILDVLSKIYILNNKEKKDIYIKLLSESEESMSILIESLIKFLNNDKVNNKLLIEGFKKTQNKYNENCENIIEQVDMNFNY